MNSSAKPTHRDLTDEEIESFREAVVKHAQTKLAKEEWRRFRIKANRGRIVQDTVDDVVNKSLASQNMSIDENLTATFKPNASVIAKLGGEPLFYIEGTGMYLWSISTHNAYSLSIWLTYPAYPDGW